MHAATHPSRAERTGYRVADSASRMLPIDPQHVHDVCSQCRERGHSSGTCTMACCVCLSATGHEQWCDMANHTSSLATTVRAVDDHAISALRDDSHGVLAGLAAASTFGEVCARGVRGYFVRVAPTSRSLCGSHFAELGLVRLACLVFLTGCSLLIAVLTRGGGVGYTAHIRAAWSR